MKVKYILPKLAVVLLIVITIASCEEDFDSIDTNIIDQNITTEFDDSQTVIAYSRKLNGVQTNDLPVYQLGVYNDPVYGKSSVNMLTQLSLSAGDIDPDFAADDVVLDSVVLYVPYFSTETTTGTGDEEESTFTLDSVYGNSPIRIEIFESNFLLRELDPTTSFEEPQEYYAEQGPVFENNLGQSLAVIDNFVPEAKVIALNDSVNQPPGLRVNLPIDFFQETIIDNVGGTQLINNNNFREFFRGLYFKSTSEVDDGSLFLFNLSTLDADPLRNARVVLYYTEGDDTEQELELLFNPVTVNVYENELPLEIINELVNANTVEGEETLYIRGGDGIITIIELFGEDQDQNGIADELEDLRDRQWLINEANLIFYVDQNRVEGGETEPERLILYDTKNNAVLSDYLLDITGANNLPVDAFTDHLGRLDRGSDANGDFYKIRITNHVSNLINRDSTNVALGLIVSSNVTQTQLNNLDIEVSPAQVSTVPTTSIVSPEGTVLHGNRSNDIDKRLKLQIFYTEPE